MPDLSVITDRYGITVSEAGTEFLVAYRRQGSVLVADDLTRSDPRPEELIFHVRAWRAAATSATRLPSM
jgi:hypothetical protein